MTADQRFLKSAHIRPDDPAAEFWMAWRDEEINDIRAQLAATQSQVQCGADEYARQAKTVHMWQLCAFAGWLGLVLFAAQKYLFHGL